MKRILLGTILLASSLGWGQNFGGGGGALPKPASSGQCLVSNVSLQWTAGSCSGTSSTNWSAIVPGTGTITAGAFHVGTGSSMDATGSGTIAATSAPWAGISGTPTTLAGYAISDAVPSARTVNAKALSSNIILGLASADFANQGTTTGVLHGNAAGNPSFGQIVNADITNATIDVTTKLTGILPGGNGGTNNGFVQIAGPATTLKTYTGPNANATLLTDQNLVTVAQGGTGVGSISGPIKGNGTAAFSAAAAADISGLWGGTCNSTTFLRGDGQCITPAGSGTINSSLQFSAAYFSAAGSASTISGLAPPTSPANVPQYLSSLNSGGSAAAPTWSLLGVGGRAVVSTSDTIAATDRGAWITYNNASSIAESLAQAGGAGFTANFVFGAKTLGAGSVTITPTTSTIDGNATLVIPQGQNCSIASLDNLNYVSRCSPGIVSVSGAIALTPSANGITLSCPTCSVTGNRIDQNNASTNSAQLAAAISDETGSGGSPLLVFNQSPTIVTPTVASLVNMNHNHSNAAGGGQLTLTAFSSTSGSGATVGATNPTLTGPVIASSTVASLPSAAASTGQIYAVTDSNSATACTTGGGSNIVQCRSNGTSWLPFGDGAAAGGAGLPDPGSSGMVARTGAGPTTAARTLTSASSQRISITNGDGVSGNPTFDIGTNIVSATSAAGAAGQMAYSTSNNRDLSYASLAPSTQTDAATITWAIASVPLANATVTLGGNRTLNITNPMNGGTYVLRIVQDGTGTRTLALGTGCTWKVINGGTAAITLSTAANAIDILSFYYDGTNCYANLGKTYN